MIIKKNKLYKIMGADVQEPEENMTNSSQVISYAQNYDKENCSSDADESQNQNSAENNNDYNLKPDQCNEVYNAVLTQTDDLHDFIPPEISTTESPASPIKDEEINLFDLDNIDFTQRHERRRGNRRRGFRRVDDRNLVSRAREEAEAIRDTAQKEGYQAGLEQAQSDILELKNTLGEFINAKQEVFDKIAPELLDISVDIAKKIIKKEIEQSPEVLINTIVDVLKTSLSKEETKVTLRVNPAEVNEIKQAVPEILNLAGIDTKIVVLSDEEVTEGGCQVTTTNGIVDATLESRIGVVTQALREL